MESPQGADVPQDKPAEQPRASSRRRCTWTNTAVALFLACAGMLVAFLVPFALDVRHRIELLELRKNGSSNLRAISIALQMYSNEFQSPLPNLQNLLDAGVVAPELLLDPASGHTPPTRDYSFALLDFDVHASSDTLRLGINPAWPLAWSDPEFSGGEGANVLFQDGHVEFVKEPEFSRLLAQFRQEVEAAYGQPPQIVPRSPEP